jgi:ribonuclease HI
MTVYVDGGARGNPGPAAIGFVVYDDAQQELYRFGAHIGNHTNNYAEYMALIEALGYLESACNDAVATIYSDSQLIVRQVNGQYKVRDSTLKSLHHRASQMIKNIHGLHIAHIRRSENTVADTIVNRVLDKRDIHE